ncbi:hypothetical protein CYMTET_11170 [Cymbomonas tetramitiformis]|uniref:NADP-dependent oxidoreductase domain-containing protein n=1 Tax=Cymbomonas tetramitiformis TaxID=36881 RepID=A0AAE0GN23_9CHLO|nr:hypothetical protein CYMTET_11170 [Cymbomonas tetramitiformis]
MCHHAACAVKILEGKVPVIKGKHQHEVLRATDPVGDVEQVSFDRRSALLGIASTPAWWTATTLPAGARNVTTIPTWTLDGGVEFPILALNTVGLTMEDAERAVRLAQEAGITHVDFHPDRERDGVAKFIASSGREGLFLNTKIRKAPPGISPTEAAEATRRQIDEDLGILGVDSVDMLMLRDSADCDVIQAQWAALEAALAAGKTRSIGVINFCEFSLSCVLQSAVVKPAINYFMLHVGMGPDAHGLRSFGESRGVRTFAYGAVGEPGPSDELLSSPVLRRIGAAHKRSAEEVALRWVLQNGAAVSVRPTTAFGLGVSTCTEGPTCSLGLQARAQSFEWSLTSEEMAELNSISSPDGNPTLFSSTGCPGSWGSLGEEGKAALLGNK